MGLGSSTPRKKTYYLRFKSNKEVKGVKVLQPHFATVLYDENGQKTVLDDEIKVSGYLCSIGHSQREWPKDSGDMVMSIELTLVEGDALYKVQFGAYTNVGRSIMNTICGTQIFNYFEVRVYAKDDFANAFITNDGQKCKWKFDRETDINPKIVLAPDPQKPGKQVKIYHAVNDMHMAAWKETEPIVAEHARKMGYAAMAGLSPTGVTNNTPSSTQHLDPSQQNSIDSLNQSDLDEPGDEPFFSNTDEDDLPF